MCIGFSLVFFVIVGSVCVFRVMVLVVVVIVALALAFLYPYLVFRFSGPVLASWGVSGQSSLLNVVIYFNLQVENPNPYSVSVVSSGITVSYDDGVTLNLQPEYLPVVLAPHSTGVITYLGSVSLAQAALLALSPPTSFTATWQATVQTPLGTKTVTCTATTYIPTNQTTQICTG